jgi:hypothetical protein
MKMEERRRGAEKGSWKMERVEREGGWGKIGDYLNMERRGEGKESRAERKKERGRGQKREQK